jgi:hypothetical protein
VLLDPGHREAVVMVPGGGRFPVRGPPSLGGVGLENFRAFVEMLPDYTSAPIALPERPSRAARREGPLPPPSR